MKNPSKISMCGSSSFFGLTRQTMAKDEFFLMRTRMVAEQLAGRGIHDPRVLTVMGSVLRQYFIPADDFVWAYADGPLPIGYGQTISQPYIVALMTELLAPQPTDRVLEVGGGCGYQAAVLGALAKEVHTVELIPELAHQAGKTLSDLGYTHIHVHAGDGSLGWPETAPYNRILVAAAAPHVPQPLLDQLAEDGQLVIPVGSRKVQHLEVWKRIGKEFNCRLSLEVCFVPLRGQFGWKD
jgi:protein-L-isoaspartate(D-aspartate) O-methyltransferase